MPTPKVDGALWGLTRDNQFARLKKEVVDHELVETNKVIDRFQGNLQPVPAQKLRLLREGERTWKYWSLLTKKDLDLDEIIVDPANKQYRVLEFADWTQANYGGYLLAEQPPRAAAPAPYATGPREPIKVVADILQQQLGLPDDAVVVPYEKVFIPKQNGLHITLSYVGPEKVIANVNEFDAATQSEIQSLSASHLVQIDLLSYDASARRRKEEAAMALASIYAVQQMELYRMSISRNPSPFLDASSAEPTKLLNRFIATAQLFAVHYKVLANAPYFDAFAGQITEGGPLISFTPAPI